MSRPKGVKNKKGAQVEKTNESLAKENTQVVNDAQASSNEPSIENTGTEQTTPEQTDAAEQLNIFDTSIPKVESPLDIPIVEKPQSEIPAQPQEDKKSTSKGEDKKNVEFKESPASSAPVAPPKSPEEIRSQAQQSADMFWKLYDKLHLVFRFLGKTNEDELLEEHLSGKLDLNQSIPFGKGEVTLRTFLMEINKTIDTEMVVSQELKDAATPAIVRICIKRGWLLSDEYYVAGLLMDDLSYKVGILAALKKSAKLVISSCRQMVINQKKIIKQNEELLRNKEQTTKPEPESKVNQNGAETKEAEKATEEWAAMEIKDDGTKEEVVVEKV